MLLLSTLLRRMALLLLFLLSFFSCTKDDGILDLYLDNREVLNDIPSVVMRNNSQAHKDSISISQYAPLGLKHQSAAAFGDYAFFVTDRRSQISLYNLSKKEFVCKLSLESAKAIIYHCNQSTFGVKKYDPADPFPLLYISQRAEEDKRCFIEVYRILPTFDEVISEYSSFKIEQVQTIYLPAMSYENSLGNANCVIDNSECMMYTYSRNNNSAEKNYERCKISKFNIPDIDNKIVILEDSDIVSSFMLDCSAVNMQGGCINNGYLYIGQGYPGAGYIYFNIVDLITQTLIQRHDLKSYRVNWEPEGCFFYDGSVMLAHTSAICRIDIE